MKKSKLCLFDGYGVELEYMIVDASSLAVRPLCDKLLLAEHNSLDDVERGAIAWSNELVLHVVELKTNGPAQSLEGLPEQFAADVRHINRILMGLKARLMPTAMHPFMDPLKETQLWPHEFNSVYESFNKIFDCRGHGWANLQSTHINLPFGDDAEFGQLHAAIRLLLPILPALAASSPIFGGKVSATLDARLRFYADNARRVPAVSGQVIPEAASSRKDYETRILARIYRDMADHDPQGVLQHEWVNARGAIARFDRSAIEIRTLDVQECPLADLSIAAAVVAVLQALVAQRWLPAAQQQAWPIAPLVALHRDCIVHGPDAVIKDAAYLKAFNFPDGKAATAGELWHHLIQSVWPASAPQAAPWRAPLQIILQQGPLAQRIVRALGDDTSRQNIKAVYQELCACLEAGKLFTP